MEATEATQAVRWRVVDDGGSFRWGHAGDELIAEWDGVLRLRATADGDLRALEPLPGARADVVDKTRCGAAAAFLRALRRRPSFHASAVALGGDGLLCLGPSGAGKSTTAERLCRRAGTRLLADDVTGMDLLAEGWVLLPSEAAVWLALDGGETKTRVTECDVASSPAVVRCIASLAFATAPGVLVVRELRGADAASTLLQSMFRFDETPALRAHELDVVGSLVAQARVVQATRSTDIPADAFVDALLEHVAK